MTLALGCMLFEIVHASVAGQNEYNENPHADDRSSTDMSRDFGWDWDCEACVVHEFKKDKRGKYTHMLGSHVPSPAFESEAGFRLPIDLF